MNVIRSLVLLLAISVTPLLHGQQQDLLAGRWRSEEASAAGVSAVFEFRAGNQVESGAAAIVEEKYRLIGTDTIALQSKAGEQKFELEWDDKDRGRIEDEAAGKVMSLARTGKASDSRNRLVGEWNTTHEWKGQSYPARARFSADGKVVWVITLRHEKGSYTVQNSKIRMEFPNRPVVEGSFVVTPDRLTLPNPKGGETNFLRL